MSEPKKVLIAMPTLGLDPDPNRWLRFMLNITNDIRKAGMSHASMFPYKETWWPACNQIWNTAFQNNFDYILRIDDDVWGGRQDAFRALVEADKDVIGAAYPMRMFPYQICAFDRVNKSGNVVDIWNKETVLGMSEVRGTGVQPCDLIGFGMTLIKVEPFKYLERPIYKGEQNCPDDTYFAQGCIDAGIQQFVHMDVMLGHRDVTPSNRMYLFNSDARMYLRTGHIKSGVKFHDDLIELFGEDGMKDIDKIKGLGFVEPSKIVRPS
jgi:hypothetical protein